MSVAIGESLAHSDHGTAWPPGFCQARYALMLVGAAAQRRSGAAAPLEHLLTVHKKYREYRQELAGGLSSLEVLRVRPVVAKVGLWVILCPVVEDLHQRSCLPTSGRQILLQHEGQDDVALGREVRNVLGGDHHCWRSFHLVEDLPY
jgi:hypothetical protein